MGCFQSHEIVCSQDESISNLSKDESSLSEMRIVVRLKLQDTTQLNHEEIRKIYRDAVKYELTCM